jgi:hypothetical protein
MQAAAKVGHSMSPSEIAMELKKRDSHLFSRMTPQVVGAWIDCSGTRPEWKKDVSERAEKYGNRPRPNITRKSILAPFPDVEEGIINHLRRVRKTGAGLDNARCRAIIVARLQLSIPQIFQTPAHDGSFFQCSTSWVHQFLLEKLHWSYRRSTWAAQKLPANTPELCLQQFLRHSITTRDQVIPGPGFRVNVDQTNVTLQPGSSCTYETIGSNQVTMTGREEKRAFTAVMAISDSGNVLPIQIIGQGKSSRSLPSTTSPYYQEAMDIGIKFEYSNTNTYWSTFKLMCKWVTDILVPYFVQQKATYNAPEKQECILQLDVWSVHRSIAFRTWLDANYNWITYLYVPANCTGIAQPCDVGIQRPFKLAIKQAQHADIVEETLHLLQSGVDPENVRLDTSIGTLRDRSVGWLVKAYNKINNPSMVKKVGIHLKLDGDISYIYFQAFTLCSAGENFNLSYESLTSNKAWVLLRDVQKNNPDLWSTITSAQYQTKAEIDVDADDDKTDSDDDIEDGEEVPVDIVLKWMASNGKDIPPGYEVGADGALRVSNASEVYEGEEEEVDDEILAIEYGRGKRRKIYNKNYNDFWCHWTYLE